MWSRRCVRWSGLLIAILFFAGLGLSWWAASNIASPARRPLQDYHHEFIAAPAAHGVRLQRFTLADATPCLMVEPQASMALGPRGLRVREQLLAKTVSLAPPGEIVGTLVLVHGRKGRKEDYLLIAERFCAVGFRCLIPDLPGHGDHPQSIARYGTAEAALPDQILADASVRFAFDPQPAGLMGMSMGGSVALHAAAKRAAPWKALAIVSSFDALRPVIVQQASTLSGAWLGGLWAHSTGWFYSSRTGQSLADVHPAALAATLSMPTLIAHGTKDRVISIDAGRRLYQALPATLPKQWVEIPGADHDNVLITDFPIYATLAEWMLRHVAERSRSLAH